MFKRISILVLTLLLLVGCFSKEYTFEIKNEVIVLNQSTEEFEIAMLDHYIDVYFGDNLADFSEVVSYEGEVDLSKVGVYDIELNATHKNKTTYLEVTVNVVDTIAPEFYVFEKELLIYEGEDIELSSEYFFINLNDKYNGIINDRMKVEGDYDLAVSKSYPILLTGVDNSGNSAEYPINVRVTDLIDEKAQYLFKKATLAANGKTLIFNNDDENDYVINNKNSFNVFTPSYLEHFFWLSGITGEYNNKQSGVNLSIVDGKMFADFSKANKVNGYEQTTLEIQYEAENYRHYLATSYYNEDGKESKKLSRFVIRKVEGVWLVDEFYIPY